MNMADMWFVWPLNESHPRSSVFSSEFEARERARKVAEQLRCPVDVCHIIARYQARVEVVDLVADSTGGEV